jgi:hypothetical protein
MKFGSTTEKFVLNCSDGETTLRCLSIAYGCRIKKLRRILRSIDVESIYKTDFDKLDIPPTSYLYDYVKSLLGSPKKSSSIYWFHLTRTPKDNTFCEGIIPLNNILEKLWDTLESSFKDGDIRSNLQVLRRKGVKNDHYAHKIKSKVDQGPFGILVKEAAFHLQRLGHHDYLGIPEIIEDICADYKNHYGKDVYDELLAALQPCIVAVKSKWEASKGKMMGALYYAYTYANGKPVSGASVVNVNCGGRAVHRSEIQSISFV